MSNNSIWPIDRTTSGFTTPDQSGPGSIGIEEVIRILQSSLDCLLLYTGDPAFLKAPALLKPHHKIV